MLRLWEAIRAIEPIEVNHFELGAFILAIGLLLMGFLGVKIDFRGKDEKIRRRLEKD